MIDMKERLKRRLSPVGGGNGTPPEAAVPGRKYPWKPGAPAEAAVRWVRLYRPKPEPKESPLVADAKRRLAVFEGRLEERRKQIAERRRILWQVLGTL